MNGFHAIVNSAIGLLTGIGVWRWAFLNYQQWARDLILGPIGVLGVAFLVFVMLAPIVAISAAIPTYDDEEDVLDDDDDEQGNETP